MTGCLQQVLALAELGGSTPIRLAGGDTCHVHRVGRWVVKCSPSAPSGLFAAEARGLRALAGAGARVPRVRWVGERGLVLSFMAPGAADWPGLGRMVASLHRNQHGPYGSLQCGFLGPVPLPAGTAPQGVSVLAELRLRPLLALTRGAIGSAGDRLEDWLESPVLPVEGPSLVHGDLWSGNVHMSSEGPALLDPSVQRAERAYDLAMMELFGGFLDAFWGAYEEVWPIPHTVRAALPAYRLVFLLVHVHLFGGAYVPAVHEAVAALR